MSTVTVTATVELSNTPPRVKLDVTDIGTPNLFAVTVTRLDPDGRVVPVRTADGNPLTLTTSGANRVGLLYDYEMPYGSVVTYSTEESPSTTSAEVTVAETRTWLIHPGVPAISVPVTISSLSARARRVQRGVLYPLGRSTPVVQTGGVRQSAEYDLQLFTSTDDERAGINTLIADAGTLLLNVPSTNRWGVSAEYVSVGDIAENRVARFVGNPFRTWDLPCTVVDRPSGGTQAQRVYSDLLVYATYADLKAAYVDYAALLAGP